MVSMKNYPVRCLLLLMIGLGAVAAQAQVVPAYHGKVNTLWVGAEYSNLSASFPYQSSVRVSGVGIFANYEMTSHLGVEATTRFLKSNTIYDESENNYLAGVRYRMGYYGKFQPYAKVLLGLGSIQYPHVNGRYFAFVPAAGVSYRFSKKWTVHGEYEYQYWMNSPGFKNEPEHTITPNGFHIGVAYRAFHRQPFGEKPGEQ